MRFIYYVALTMVLLIQNTFAQQSDTTDVMKKNIIKSDTTKEAQFTILKKDSSKYFYSGKTYFVPRPTLPPLRISEKQRKMQLQFTPDKNMWHPEDKLNYDALNMPTTKYDYELTKDYMPPLIPMVPLEVPQQDIAINPLPFNQYEIPTRKELDILEILWTKDDVMDTTIYSCLDKTMNITMADLQQLLARMTHKGFLSRKIVSPRFEFNAFGILIEMSPQNRRNRVYEYHTNVDEKLMKTFIDANAYLFGQDSSIVNLKQLRAARRDKTLLQDLNVKIKQPKQ